MQAHGRYSEESHQSVAEYRLVLEVLILTGSDVLFMHWHVQMLLVSDLPLPIRKFQGLLAFKP
jgi:hypothetical protein